MVRTPHCRRHAAGRRAVARARHAHRDAWFRSHDLAGNRNLVVNVACSDIVVVTPAATAPAPAPAALERKHPIDARQQLRPQISRQVSCPRNYGRDQFGRPLFHSSSTNWKAAHP